MMIRPKSAILIAVLFCCSVGTLAQTIADELQSDVRRMAGMRYALTLAEQPQNTPPPAGKYPFYVNHYGCPSAYYLERPEYYDHPYNTLMKADSLGKLTPMGRKVLYKVKQLRNDAREKTGELTELGKQQAREQARQLIKLLPEIFTDRCFVDGRSIVDNHCLLTLGEVSLEMSRAHHPMRMNADASHRSRMWMNPVDKELEAMRSDSLTMARYADFIGRWAPDDVRLMGILFNDADFANGIDASALSRQLFDLACSTQYVENTGSLSLYDVFTPEELHRHWLRRNAWAYICYGGCTLNGGYQPYEQRRPLWNLIHQGDSIVRLDYPVVHLRYTNESMVMSLVCLLELDGYGVQTSNLDSLETLGWADYRISPLGGSMVMIHYRSEIDDPDPLVRVLLNGREARMPIKSDCEPYYHWQDVKRYYLRKLYAYAKERNDE